MNHLAHVAVAHPDPGLVVGAFLGDYVKGRLTGERPEAIERGIRLHRAVDAFTDRHEVVTRSARRFAPDFRRYAPVLLDVIFDHFLAQSWDERNSVELAAFSDTVFDIVLADRSMLTTQAESTARRMQEVGSLVRYVDPSSLERSFTYIGSRFKRDNPLDRAFGEFERLAPELKEDFELFFPDLLDFNREWQRIN